LVVVREGRRGPLPTGEKESYMVGRRPRASFCNLPKIHLAVILAAQRKLIRERSARGVPEDKRSELNLRRIEVELEKAN